MPDAATHVNNVRSVCIDSWTGLQILSWLYLPIDRFRRVTVRDESIQIIESDSLCAFLLIQLICLLSISTLVIWISIIYLFILSLLVFHYLFFLTHWPVNRLYLWPRYIAEVENRIKLLNQIHYSLLNRKIYEEKFAFSLWFCKNVFSLIWVIF